MTTCEVPTALRAPLLLAVADYLRVGSCFQKWVHSKLSLDDGNDVKWRFWPGKLVFVSLVRVLILLVTYQSLQKWNKTRIFIIDRFSMSVI